jgi:RNA polymerase sigma factor (TIGR02999 family)
MKDPADGPSKIEVSQLLKAWGQGHGDALEKLAPLIEKELHRFPHKYMSREKPGHTLQTTALVNELYLRLVNLQQVSWQDREHFFGISARMMRRILTDFARSKHYLKRGAAALRMSFEEALAVSQKRDAEIVALDDALTQLAIMNPRKSQVVELRFFGGLSVEETAEVLKVSHETVKRDWRFAKSWLRRALGGDKDDETGAVGTS